MSDSREPENVVASERNSSLFLDQLGVAAVVFDMDGVLIDSMGLHYEAYRRVLGPEGLSVEPIDITSREGLSTPAVLRSLSDEKDWGLSQERVQQLADRRREIFYAIYEHRVFPEIPQILDWLKGRGYRLAVVSGATQQSLEVCLHKYPAAPNGGGLGEWFSLILSGTSVARGKPYPDPYLKALEKLGLEGRQVLVVENAPAGITAARQAGCYCAAIQTTLPRSYLELADWVVPDHAALFELFQGEGRLSTETPRTHGLTE